MPTPHVPLRGSSRRSASVLLLLISGLLLLSACSTGPQSSDSGAASETMATPQRPGADAGSAPASEGEGASTSLFPEYPEGPVSMLDQRLMELVNRERELFARGQEEGVSRETMEQYFRELVREWEIVLADNPESLKAHLLYGKLLRRVGQRERAQEVFFKANEINPNVAVVKQQLGNYLAEENKPELALAYFMEAVRLDPEQPVYHYSIGKLLYDFQDTFIQQGNFTRETLDERMLESFRLAAQFGPDKPDFVMRYGEAFYDIQYPDWERALAVWNSVRHGDYSEIERIAATIHAARVLLELGRLEEARKMAESVDFKPFEESRQQLLELIRERQLTRSAGQ